MRRTKSSKTSETITVLGSTGSAGTRALEVLEREKIRPYGLSCDKNIDLLFEQIKKYEPIRVVVAKKKEAMMLEKRLRKEGCRTSIAYGEQKICELAKDANSQKMVLCVAGEAATAPLIEAVRNRKKIILVNKEAVVCHSDAIQKEAQKSDASIIPADSEPCALYQCFEALSAMVAAGYFGDAGEAQIAGICRIPIHENLIKKIILPCSGGPFFGKNIEQLKKVSVKDALCHPKWKMGKKITVDSATLVNKGLEVLSTHFLFGLPCEKIETLIHRKCQIHGAIHLRDGSVLAVVHRPDMKIPLKYAMFHKKKSSRYVRHFKTEADFLDKMGKETFLPIDVRVFAGIEKAYEAARTGGETPKRFCRFNEKKVKKFLAGEVDFTELLDMIGHFS